MPETDRPKPDRHTAIGVALNCFLLIMIAYGYWQSEALRWAWALVAVHIAVVTINYARHLLSGR